MAFNKSKITRASRLSVAMVLSFFYVAYIGMSSGIWVLMTCAIVLFDNPTYGGTITKSYLRFLGTFLAAGISLLFITLFANNVIINLAGIVAGVFIAAYLYMDTKQAYVGGLISWTLPIMLLNNNDIKSAFLRLMNIVIGIAIAWAMLRFFYPEYARDKLLHSTKNTLKELQLLLKILCDNKLTALQIQNKFLEQEQLILAEMGRFPRWLEEAKPETKSSPEYITAAAKAYWHARRLYRLLSVLIYHFDCSDIVKNERLKDKINLSIVQIEGIIKALNHNLHHYYVPHNLIIKNTALEQKKIQHDRQYNQLSIDTILDIIHQESNNMVGDLFIVFQSRKANNYYSATS